MGKLTRFVNGEGTEPKYELCGDHYILAGKNEPVVVLSLEIETAQQNATCYCYVLLPFTN